MNFSKLLLYYWEYWQRRELNSTEFSELNSTFESNAVFNYFSRLKEQLNSAHVKFDVWTGPKWHWDWKEKLKFSYALPLKVKEEVWLVMSFDYIQMRYDIYCTKICVLVNRFCHTGRKNGFASTLLSANMMQIRANWGINLSKGGKCRICIPIYTPV